jgi:uncharacterized cupredoxin-like copper-binding protein
VGLIALMAATAPLAAAQDDTSDQMSGPTEITVEVHLGPGDSNPYNIHPSEIAVPAGATVTFHVVNLQDVEHNFALQSQDFEYNESDIRQKPDGSGEELATPLLQAGEEYNLTVTLGEDYSGSIRYICSVPGHAGSGMEGTLSVGATGGGGEEQSIDDYGVHYLAYWVGIVSFVIIFVVLFATFFLLRYGESPHVVDHRTSGPETVTVAAGAAESEGAEMVEPLLPSPARVAQVLIALALVGLAVFYLL